MEEAAMTIMPHVQKIIDSWVIYKMDVNDPTFKSWKEIEEIRSKNLQRQVKLCNQYSRYYKAFFREHGINPDNIKTTDDLQKLPLTTKRHYMADPLAFKLEFDRLGLFDATWDISYTTGTTSGRPSPFYNTVHDHYSSLLQAVRSFKIGGGPTPDDMMINLFPLGPIPHIGWGKTVEYPIAVGIPVICANVGSPHPEFPVHRKMQTAIDMIEMYSRMQKAANRSLLVMGVASFIRRLLMQAEEQKRDFGAVRMVRALGEAAPKELREDIRRRLQNMGAGEIFVGNDYGFTEMQGSTTECVELGGCHNPSPDLYYLEVVNPDTGERLEDGKAGALAITHLNRRGTVLLRYLVGDLVAITRETCPNCGRNGERVIVATGSTYSTRESELLKIKGVLINPEILRNEVSTTPGVIEYCCIFKKADSQDPYSSDVLELRVAPLPGTDKEALEKELIERVFNAVEMRPKIVFQDMNAIFDPTVSLKAQRVLDFRPKVK
jgi:phenylacetate-coenzyme A ligase PaaK-like adenylate-forming protein